MKPELISELTPKEHHPRLLNKWYRVLRGNISYGSITNSDDDRNIDGRWATAVTPAIINTEFAVTHILGRVPVGFHLMNKDGATDVYKSTTPWTSTTIYLKATGININITLFLV